MNKLPSIRSLIPNSFAASRSLQIWICVTSVALGLFITPRVTLARAGSVRNPFKTLENFAIEHDQYGNSEGSDTPVGKIVINADGSFYVVCRYSADVGAQNEAGRIIKVVPGQPQVSVHTFSDLNGGLAPEAGLLVGSDGNYYGTTTQGGVGHSGTIYVLTPAGQFSVLYAFSGGDGNSPSTDLVQGPDGNFYGTCYTGGAGSTGTIFKVTPGGVLAVIHNFGTNDPNDGDYPTEGLTVGSDGNYYGTTPYGGAHNRGVVYKVASDGTFTVLYNFTSADLSGFAPSSALTQASDGNFYGACTNGGNVAPDNSTYGLIYRITPAGQYTVVYKFSNTDGELPYGALLAKDGCLYGTTSGGGPYEGTKPGDGTIYKLSLNGTLTTLHTFHNGDASGIAPYLTEGASPVAPLVSGTDGVLYGTTQLGGSGNNGDDGGGIPPYDDGGTVFRYEFLNIVASQ